METIMALSHLFHMTTSVSNHTALSLGSNASHAVRNCSYAISIHDTVLASERRKSSTLLSPKRTKEKIPTG